MKTPKRIADLLSKKQTYIDSQRNKLESSVIKLQSELFNSLISNIIPELDIKDGLIQDTAKNYKLIAQLDKTYKDFQSSSKGMVLSQIITTTSKIADLSNKYFTLVLSEVPDKFAKVIADANKLINLQIGLDGDKVFKGGWLDSYFNSNTIGLDLKKLVSQAVTSNMDRKDLTTILKDKITGTADYTGSLERQFNMYTYDLYQQYDRAYNQMIGNEFGFNYFIYQGGLIEDSRDFCVCHNNKVWSVEEMKTWVTWTPSQGEYPAGYKVKAKDLYSVPSYMNYPGYDPGLNLGGYHCRHSQGWISDELAFEKRPDLKPKE
jgi:hypothetical protein